MALDPKRSNYDSGIEPDIPGPPVVNVEPGGNTESDGINVPMVTVIVALCAVLLVLIVVGVEAYFFHVDANEKVAKQLPQGAPGTPLGIMLQEQTAELNTPGLNPRLSTADKKVFRISIDKAIEETVTAYSNTK